MVLVELDEMLVSYAVLLNRPQWLTEERVEVQKPVWHRLATLESGRGRIVRADVDLAITTAIGSGMSISEILPSLIVRHAAVLARARAERVKRMLLSPPVVWLAPSRSKVQNALDNGDDPAEMLDAIRREIRLDLLASGTPDADIGRVLNDVDEQLTIHTS